MNYWYLGGKFGMCTYMYVDLNVDRGYVADSLFYRREIPVRFKNEMVKDGDKYRMIFCRIKKKYRKAFEEALRELVDKMNLLGHTDYLDYCIDLRTSLEECNNK